MRELTLIVLLTLPLSLIIVTGIAKRSQNYFRRQQRSLGDLNGHVEEMYVGHKIVKAFGHEGKAIESGRRGTGTEARAAKGNAAPRRGAP